MPGRRITAPQRERFFKLLAKPPEGPGLSIAAASDRLGISRQTGYRIMNGYKVGLENVGIQDRTAELPAPRTWDELDPLAQAILEDFGLFSEKALCRNPSPWRLKAAAISVEAILDKSEKHYAVANLPPGVGKSTLWTLDIPLWLQIGGGFCDPAKGRALRFMFGHRAMATAEHYVFRMKQILESPRPYYDFEQERRAEVSLVQLFGRFKPDPGLGDPSKIWARDQFMVAQIGEFDYYQKEPTVQAASREKGFIGERVEYAAWDDLVTDASSRKLETVESDGQWMEKETERRVEPGGVLWLVGQRIGPNDLFRNRLNKVWADDEDQEHRFYSHIVFPAHHESTCDGNHRQWDAEEQGEGCLLDEKRLSWKEILKVRGDRSFRTVFQQEDSDPTTVLVPPIWLDGGIDVYSDEVPGCYDHDRGFWEWPEGADDMKPPLVGYAAVDVAASGWWAIEHWACADPMAPRYLISGTRRRMGANDLLDWDHGENRFVGIMEDWTQRSVDLGHPIRVWVIESNAFARHLMQYDHFHRWLKKRPWLHVIAHQTQKNKTDPKLGVEALLPGLYRSGMKRIPRKRGDLEALSYVEAKKQELTTYIPSSPTQATTTDTVMADWIGENRLQLGDILRLGSLPMFEEEEPENEWKLPPYLLRQQKEIPATGGGNR